MKLNKIVMMAILGSLFGEKVMAGEDYSRDELRRRNSYKELEEWREEENLEKPILERKSFGSLNDDIKKPGEATLMLKVKKPGYLTSDERREKEQEEIKIGLRNENFKQLPGEYERVDYGSYDSREVKKNIDGFNSAKQAKYWFNVAVKMKPSDHYTTEDGKVYSKKDCYVKALSIDPRYINAWVGLGFALLLHENVTINGDQYSKSDCFVKALSIYPNYANVWVDSGVALLLHENVTVNGATYSKKDCYLKALSIDPTYVHAWNNLGLLLARDENVTINGDQYSKSDCFVKALNINPKSVSLWFNLGGALDRDENVIVNGERYSQKDCYVKALSIDPDYVNAWNSLKPLLKDGETVEINGKTFTKK